MGDLQIPQEYPAELHERVSQLAKQHFLDQGTGHEVQNEFRIALGSVRYRFKTFAESGVAFADSIESHGDAPPQPHR